MAKYWGLLPHVIWHYPFRYYKELRDAYITSLQPGPAAKDEDENSIDFDINAEIFKGDSL